MTAEDFGFWLVNVGGAVLVGWLVQRWVSLRHRARLRQTAEELGLVPGHGEPTGWQPPPELGEVHIAEWWQGTAEQSDVRVFSLRTAIGAPRGHSLLSGPDPHEETKCFTAAGPLTSDRLRTLWQQWSNTNPKN